MLHVVLKILDWNVIIINIFSFIVVRNVSLHLWRLSASTRNKDLDDDLVATLNLIPFVRASALDETGSLNPESWTAHKETQGKSLG